MAVVSWGSVQLRRFRQRLYLLPVGVARGTRGQDHSHTDKNVGAGHAREQSQIPAKPIGGMARSDAWKTRRSGPCPRTFPGICQNRSHEDSSGENAVHWDGCQPLLWGGWILRLEPVHTGGFKRPAQGFTVRSREGGERCHPSGRPHSQTLKKLLQEADVEPWLRSQLPVLTVEGHIAVVADLWFCRGWEATTEQGYRLCWRRADKSA